MKEAFEDGLWLWVVLIGILVALSGIYPRSKSVAASLNISYRTQKTGNYQAVASNLAKAAEGQPWRTGIWEAGGHAALMAGNEQDAGFYFARAAARGELSLVGYLAWGDADWQAGKDQNALQIWQIAERLGGSDEHILPRRVALYRSIGDDLGLINALKAMLERPSPIISPGLAVGPLYHELGLLLAAYDPLSAPTYLEKAAQSDPTLALRVENLVEAIRDAARHDDPVYTGMISGRALANQGYWDFAHKAFENVLKEQPDYSEAWAYLGEARQHAVPGEDPLTALEQALALDPTSIAANTFTALYWQRQGENVLSLKYLQAASELDPENPAFLVEIGNLAALMGDLDGGEGYLRQALLLSGDDPLYVRQYLKFSLLFNLNLRTNALPIARQLVADHPKDPASLVVMGELLFHLDDLLNAERFYLRSLELNPYHDQAHLRLGDLYRVQGDFDQARTHYGLVLETSLNPKTIDRASNALDALVSP